MLKEIFSLQSLVDSDSDDNFNQAAIDLCKIIDSHIQNCLLEKEDCIQILPVLQNSGRNGGDLITSKDFMQMGIVLYIKHLCNTERTEDLYMLMEQYLDVINVLSELSPEGKSLYVEDFAEIYLDILLHDRSDFRHKLEILRSLNILMEDANCTIKETLLGRPSISNKLNLLSSLLDEVGDYEFQVCIAECLFRMIPKKIREQIISSLITDRNKRKGFLKIRDTEFETDCREFLNILNKELEGSKRVFSLACDKAWLGDKELHKPDDPNYEIFWVDFNAGSERLTVFCGPYNNTNSEASSEDLWETLTVWKDDVHSCNVKRVKKTKIVNILLLKTVSDIYPSQQDVSGRSVRLQFNINYNVEEALEMTFGSDRIQTKASTVSTPLVLQKKGDRINQEEFQDESIPCTPVSTVKRNKASVPIIPMFGIMSPALSISSKVSEPISAVRINCTKDVSMSGKKNEFQTPKVEVPKCKTRVKTPVVTVAPPSKTLKKTPVAIITPQSKNEKKMPATVTPIVTVSPPPKAEKKTPVVTVTPLSKNRKKMPIETAKVVDKCSEKVENKPHLEPQTKLNEADVDSIPDSCPDISYSDFNRFDSKTNVSDISKVIEKDNRKVIDSSLSINKEVTAVSQHIKSRARKSCKSSDPELSQHTTQNNIVSNKPVNKTKQSKSSTHQEYKSTDSDKEKVQSTKNTQDDFEVLDSFPKAKKNMSRKKKRNGDTKNIYEFSEENDNICIEKPVRTDIKQKIVGEKEENDNESKQSFENKEMKQRGKSRKKDVSSKNKRKETTDVANIVSSESTSLHLKINNQRNEKQSTDEDQNNINDLSKKSNLTRGGKKNDRTDHYVQQEVVEQNNSKRKQAKGKIEEKDKLMKGKTEDMEEEKQVTEKTEKRTNGKVKELRTDVDEIVCIDSTKQKRTNGKVKNLSTNVDELARIDSTKRQNMVTSVDYCTENNEKEFSKKEKKIGRHGLTIEIDSDGDINEMASNEVNMHDTHTKNEDDFTIPCSLTSQDMNVETEKEFGITKKQASKKENMDGCFKKPAAVKKLSRSRSKNKEVIKPSHEVTDKSIKLNDEIIDKNISFEDKEILLVEPNQIKSDNKMDRKKKDSHRSKHKIMEDEFTEQKIDESDAIPSFSKDEKKLKKIKRNSCTSKSKKSQDLQASSSNESEVEWKECSDVPKSKHIKSRTIVESEKTKSVNNKQILIDEDEIRHDSKKVIKIQDKVDEFDFSDYELTVDDDQIQTMDRNKSKDKKTEISSPIDDNSNVDNEICHDRSPSITSSPEKLPVNKTPPKGDRMSKIGKYSLRKRNKEKLKEAYKTSDSEEDVVSIEENLVNERLQISPDVLSETNKKDKAMKQKQFSIGTSEDKLVNERLQISEANKKDKAIKQKHFSIGRSEGNLVNERLQISPDVLSETKKKDKVMKQKHFSIGRSEGNLVNERLQISPDVLLDDKKNKTMKQKQFCEVKQYECSKGKNNSTTTHNRKFFQANSLSQLSYGKGRNVTSKTLQKINTSTCFGFNSPNEQLTKKSQNSKKSLLLFMSYSQSDSVLPCEKGDAGADPYDFDAECNSQNMFFPTDFQKTKSQSDFQKTKSHKSQNDFQKTKSQNDSYNRHNDKPKKSKISSDEVLKQIQRRSLTLSPNNIQLFEYEGDPIPEPVKPGKKCVKKNQRIGKENKINSFSKNKKQITAKEVKHSKKSWEETERPCKKQKYQDVIDIEEDESPSELSQPIVDEHIEDLSQGQPILDLSPDQQIDGLSQDKKMKKLTQNKNIEELYSDVDIGNKSKSKCPTTCSKPNKKLSGKYRKENTEQDSSDSQHLEKKKQRMKQQKRKKTDIYSDEEDYRLHETDHYEQQMTTNSILNNFSSMCKQIVSHGEDDESETREENHVPERSSRKRSKILNTPNVVTSRSTKTPTTPGNIKKLYKSLDISVIKTPKTPVSVSNEDADCIDISGVFSQKSFLMNSQSDGGNNTDEEKKESLCMKGNHDNSLKDKKRKSNQDKHSDDVVVSPCSALSKILSRSLGSFVDIDQDKLESPEGEIQNSGTLHENMMDSDSDSSNEEDIEDVQDKQYRPRKLFKEQMFYVEEHQSVSETSDRVSDVLSDVDPTAQVSTLLKAFGIDVQRHITEKRQHLESLTRAALKSSQKHINAEWTKQQQLRSNALNKYQCRMMKELVALEKDMSSLKEAEDKAMVFFREQMKYLQQFRTDQEKRLLNLNDAQQELQEEMGDIENQASKQHALIKTKLKEDLSCMQKKLLLELQKDELNQVKRNLQTIFF